MMNIRNLPFWILISLLSIIIFSSNYIEIPINVDETSHDRSLVSLPINLISNSLTITFYIMIRIDIRELKFEQFQNSESFRSSIPTSVFIYDASESPIIKQKSFKGKNIMHVMTHKLHHRIVLNQHHNVIKIGRFGFHTWQEIRLFNLFGGNIKCDSNGIITLDIYFRNLILMKNNENIGISLKDIFGVEMSIIYYNPRRTENRLELIKQKHERKYRNFANNFPVEKNLVGN